MKRMQAVLDEYVALKEQDVKRRKIRDKDVLVDRMYDVLERAAAEETATDHGEPSSGAIPKHVTSDPWTKQLGTRSPNNRRKVQPKKRRTEHEEEAKTWEDEVLLQIAAPLSRRINQVAETRPAPAVQAWEGPPIDVDELLATFESDPKLTHALERMAHTTAVPIDAQGTAHVGSPHPPPMQNANQDAEDPSHLHPPDDPRGREKQNAGSGTYQEGDGTNGRDGRKKGTRKSLLEELEESEVEALLSGLHYT
mmetsp:Transcript_5515/g.34119  ORF Transcript_5515/g.34119 Transcript_5515/m.34119 type:complete len:252 (-) Transcript_5515:488-1243(-)